MFANLRTLFLLSTTAKLIHPTPKKKREGEINRFPKLAGESALN